MTFKKNVLFPSIEQFIKTLNQQNITKERAYILQPLIDYIQNKVTHKQAITLNFICTHNSRRSHLSQIWAQTMAQYFNIAHVTCYSGGTEATALFPMVAETLKTSGFKIRPIFKGINPIYSIKYTQNSHPIIGFSKKLDDDFNPKSEFAAIITCNSANEACPIVIGAEKRIPINFEDPKVFDNSPKQASIYLERSTQIANELFYVFSKIKN